MNRRQMMQLAIVAAVVLAGDVTRALAQPNGGPNGGRGQGGDAAGRGGPPDSQHVPEDRRRWYRVPLQDAPILTDQQRRQLRQLPQPPRVRNPAPHGPARE